MPTRHHALDLIDNHPGVVVFISDADRRFTYVSPSVKEVLGFTPDELVGTLAADLVHPDDVDAVLRASNELRGGQVTEMLMTTRVRAADGGSRLVSMSRRNLLDDPAVRGVVTIVTDVTERTAAAERVAASERRFRAMVQNSADAIALLDQDLRFQYVSDSITPMLGYTPEQLQGREALDMIERELPETAAAVLARVMSDPDAVITVQMHARALDGSMHRLKATLANRLADPDLSAIVVNFADITGEWETALALSNSEERYRNLVQLGSDLVVVLGKDGVITYASDAVELMLGYAPNDVVGLRAWDLIHPDDLDTTLDAFASVFTEEPAPTPVVRVRNREGGYVYLELTATDLTDVEAVGGVVVNIRDVSERVDAQELLRRSEELFRTLAGSSPIGIYRMNTDLQFDYVNDRLRDIAGLRTQADAAAAGVSMVHREDATALARAWARTGAKGLPFTGQSRLHRPDGQVRWVSIRTSPLRDEEGTLTGHVGTVEDITERVESQRDTERLTEVLSATSDLVAITDRAGRLLYLNEAAQKFFGLTAESMAMFDFAAVTPAWAQQRYANEALPSLRDNGIWSGEFAYYYDGAEVPVSALFIAHRDADGHLEFVSSITRDISSQKALEDRLAHQATHDPLTGLPNRLLLLDRLQMALARSTRSGATVGVLFLDLDHFKVVNDSLGHSRGDELLIAIAERLSTVVRPGDTVARFGGDEFVVLCEDVRGEEDGLAIAARIDAQLAAPIMLDETEVFVTASSGLAVATGDADGEELIRDADAAMYRAKARGRARFELFDSEMRHHAVDRLDIENALRRAVERRELRAVYQPNVDLTSGRIIGSEALLRWEHPDRGLLSPADFLEVAEETGLIIPIGRWMLEQACRQAVRWRAELPEQLPFYVCVNLSGRQLSDPGLYQDLADIIERTGVDPAYIDLEITESVAMEDAASTAETFTALKGLGVKLAIDDFGTGYSSLSYLRRFPVDLLKVDRTFVDGLEDDAGDVAIVQAVISMAHSLGLGVIAEGVETAGQLAKLREMSCDIAQGFYFAKPLPPDEVAELVVSGVTW